MEPTVVLDRGPENREKIMINPMDSDFERRLSCFLEAKCSGLVKDVSGGTWKASWEIVLTRLRRTRSGK